MSTTSEKTAAESFVSCCKTFTKSFKSNMCVFESMNDLTRRIVVLGKTGAGKSSLANTIFGQKLFATNNSANSGTSECKAETKSVNGRNIMWIDTPGFFDPGRSEEDLKPEIVRCITECAPGPHAFLIVLKVEKFTEHEQAVVTKICQCFSEDALKYAVIVFTHGDQLSEGMEIEEFVSQNENLRDLVKKCGGRCHVTDNKYWKNNQQDEYRSNQFQVAELLNTLDKMIEANQGSCYSNEMLQAVKREIQREEEHIRQTSGDLSQQQIRNRAQMSVLDTLMIRLAGIATGALLGAFLGVVEMVEAMASTARGRAAVAMAAQSGVVKGFRRGYDAAEGAGTLEEAMKKAAEAVWKQSVSGVAADPNSK